MIRKILSLICIVMGTSLLAVNVYGLFQDVRPSIIETEPLRFPNDLSLNYEQAMKHIEALPDEDHSQYAIRMTDVISQSLAHIHWNEEYDVTRYNQLIPIWENYFLYFMGKYSGIPEYEKYHYANYQRSLKRGIGICGDASMVMSQLFDQQGIPNQILSFPGHVIVTAEIDGEEKLFDPDFGVTLPYSPAEIKDSPTQIYQHYIDKGYSLREIKGLMRAYELGYQRWDGVKHFITNKYYFEKVAYVLKWPFPIIIMIIGFALLLSKNKTKKHK
ncbi:hypothetical protein [Paraglaciecola sp.]|uniref:hypothetical protein n=1 Tax=Paraglaciecola sp. TaxID=1920173 RepID=UPI003266CCCB